MSILESTTKLRSILSGWKNYVFESEDISITARLRAIECAKCDQAVSSWYAELIDDKIQDVQGLICNGCGGPIKCPLSTKLRSKDEKCPKNLWK